MGDLVGADESGDLLEEGFVGEAAEDDLRGRGLKDRGGRFWSPFTDELGHGLGEDPSVEAAAVAVAH
nr:hypothetical protein [Cryobacterium sp. Sr8]